MRVRMRTPPRRLKSGETACYIPTSLMRDRAELALSIILLCNRRLFGYCYWGLQPDYFDAMPRNSGVLALPVVPTRLLAPDAVRPGDVDLLIIPYEGDELVLDRTLAVEVKAIRASFARPGRSPNDFGFSQARGLTALGFPYVAIAHLIVSDIAPPEVWRPMSAVEVLDQEGRTTSPFDVTMDMLPVDLIDRAFGRLEANCPDAGTGLVSAYLDRDEFVEEERARSMRLWMPRTRPAAVNPRPDAQLLARVSACYEANADAFFPIPRY